MPLNIYFTVSIRSFTNCCILHVSRPTHWGFWLLLSHKSTLKASLPDLYSNPQTRGCQFDCDKSARQCEEIKYCCQGKWQKLSEPISDAPFSPSFLQRWVTFAAGEELFRWIHRNGSASCKYLASNLFRGLIYMTWKSLIMRVTGEVWWWWGLEKACWTINYNLGQNCGFLVWVCGCLACFRGWQVNSALMTNVRDSIKHKESKRSQWTND